MWRLLIFLLVLIFSVWFGIVIVRHPGYLLLVYQPWMVQMPLWFALLSILFAFGLFYLLIDSWDRIQFLFYRLKNWLHFRREHRSYSNTQQGLAALIEGKWKKSESLLRSGVNQTVDPLINYLAAAKAAHEQGEYERRDAYIKKAYAVAPKAELAIGLTQAQLVFEQGEFKEAETILQHLLLASPRHPRVLKLLEKTYIHLGKWKDLLTLITPMRKAKILDSEQATLFEKNIYSELFIENKNLTDVATLWESMPRSIRKNPDIIYLYAKQILHLSNQLEPASASEMQKEIENLIRKSLNHTWHAKLVTLYSTLPFPQLNRQLVIVGAWLKMYGQQPELLLLLGKLCMRLQLWGKAKDYFEKCLVERPSAEVVFEYGKLLDHLGETQAALTLYRNGLEQLAAARNRSGKEE